MKKTALIFCIALMAGSAKSQMRGGGQLAPHAITPQQKASNHQMRDEMMMRELEVPAERQEEFKKIYHSYLEAQHEVKSGFRNDFDADRLSDEEARQKLDQSFAVGQKLLDTRREYAQKMQTVVKPQQVLKMFRNEGMMREKMMERKLNNNLPQDSRGTGGYKNGAQGMKTP